MTDEDGSRLGELEGIVGDEDGYEAEANAAVLLQGLDIPDELHERKMSELQGGQKVRVLLAQALFGNPRRCCSTSPPTISISSPSTGSRTSSTATTAPSSPSRTTATSSTTSAPTSPTSTTRPSSPTTAATTTWCCRRPASAPASRARTSSAKRRSLSSTTSSPASPPVHVLAGELAQEGSRAPRHQRACPLQHRAPLHRFKMERPSGKNVLEFENVNKSYTQKDGKTEHVINNFSASSARRQGHPDGPQRPGQDHAAQGAAGQRPRHRREGRLHRLRHRQVGPRGLHRLLRAGPQGLHPARHDRQDWLHQFDPKAAKEDIRGILGQMLFKGEEGLKKTDALSGGEAARLLFCKIMLQKPNVLVLDEPTNHLTSRASTRSTRPSRSTKAPSSSSRTTRT
jgi:ATPase subunit of ABC transporter with duplicated ATPase domains